VASIGVCKILSWLRIGATTTVPCWYHCSA